MPPNLLIINITFEEIKARIQSLFSFRIALNTPYKLCDYKPTYGKAFRDYFDGYDFWGYADLDLVFGNLRSFITEDILDKYDKIYNQGHLSLYRNSERMNNLYLTVLPKGKAYDYKFVYTTEHPCFFDEHCGMERIMKYNNEGLYMWSMGLKTGILANISPFSYRFDFTYKGEVLKDVYFEYDNGALTLHSHNIVLPVVYAHFAKRQFAVETENVDHFKIVPNRYVDFQETYPNISDRENSKYSKKFARKFRTDKIKRAFRLGIFKYIEKVWRKQRFMPL